MKRHLRWVDVEPVYDSVRVRLVAPRSIGVMNALAVHLEQVRVKAGVQSYCTAEAAAAERTKLRPRKGPAPDGDASATAPTRTGDGFVPLESHRDLAC